MRKYILPLICGALSVLSLSSCEKETEDLSEYSIGRNFFPLQKGKYILYNVDSTYWDDFLKAEIVYHSQMRYQIADSFTNAEGNISYKVDVYQRKETTDSFQIKEIFYVTPSETNVEVTQKNLTFIKMVFPVAEGTTWDGNAKIPKLDQDYTQEYSNTNWVYSYHNLGVAFDPGNNYYDRTVTINHIDDQLNNPDLDSTLYAYRNYSQEVYAYNVGMIYKERIYWVFQPKGPDGQGGGSGYRKGYGVRMRAIENN
jgi:hypothetical protein